MRIFLPLQRGARSITVPFGSLNYLASFHVYANVEMLLWRAARSGFDYLPCGEPMVECPVQDLQTIQIKSNHSL